MQLKDIHQKYYASMPEEEFWQVVQADPTYDEAKHIPYHSDIDWDQFQMDYNTKSDHK